MRALFTLFLFWASAICFASAQNSEIEGTYQIQVINSRNQPSIPGNIDELILQNRHATEAVYVQLGTEVRLKILPLSEINRTGFTPVEKIIHITE